MDGDWDPVWTYRDRGYYSLAFIGYIFLYTLIVGGFAPPTPSLIHFNVSDEDNAYIYESDEEEETEELIINNIIY